MLLFDLRLIFLLSLSMLPLWVPLSLLPFPVAHPPLPPSGVPAGPPHGYRVRVTYRRVTLWRDRVWGWSDAFLLTAIIDALFLIGFSMLPFEVSLSVLPFWVAHPPLRDIGLGLLSGGLQGWFMRRYLYWYLWMGEARVCHYQIKRDSSRSAARAPQGQG